MGFAFFSVYPTCNWITSQRNTTFPLYLDAELAIPFIPEFFWIYISMYGLFLLPPFLLNSTQLKRLGPALIWATLLSGLIFLLLPTELGFSRIKLEDAFYNDLFSQLFTIDLPHNLVPSLHIVFSAIISFSLLEAIRNALFKSLLWSWLVLLCLSTLLVHQHHLLDLITGLAIAATFHLYFEKRSRYV